MNTIFKSRVDVEKIGSSTTEEVLKDDTQFYKMLNSFYITKDSDDYGFAPHASDGYWESWITYWMDKNVERGSFVLDVGANHGYYSLFLASKECMVHAYEPQENLCSLIEKSVDFNDFNSLIKIYEEAVSDENGWSEFLVPIHHGMNASLVTPGYMPHGHDTIKVVTSKLDDNPHDYDFIKIDAEGGEFKIWNGMQEWLKRNRDVTILMEWRYDRYPNPEAFAEDMFSKAKVTSVNFDGEEEEIDLNTLYTKKNSDWMLVLRFDSNTP